MVHLTASLVFLLGALQSVSGSAIAGPNYGNKGGVCKSSQYSKYAELAYYEPAKQYCKKQYPATVTVTAKGYGHRQPRTALPEPGYEKPAGYPAKPTKCNKGRKECLLSSVKNGPKTAARTVCSCYVPQKTVTRTVYPTKKTTTKCTTKATTTKTTRSTTSSRATTTTTSVSTTAETTTSASTTTPATTTSTTTSDTTSTTSGSTTSDSTTTSGSTTSDSTTSTQSSTTTSDSTTSTQTSTTTSESTTSSTTSSDTTTSTTTPDSTTTTSTTTTTEPTTTTTTTTPPTTTTTSTTTTTTSTTTTTTQPPIGTCGARGQFAAPTKLRTRNEGSVQACQNWCIEVPDCENVLVLPRDDLDAFGPNECTQVAGEVQRVGPGSHRVFARQC